MDEQRVKEAQELQYSHRELFLREVRKVVEEALYYKIPYIDPHDDESWMVDAMMGGLRNRLTYHPNVDLGVDKPAEK